MRDQENSNQRWIILSVVLAVFLVWSLPCLTDKRDCNEPQSQGPDHVADRFVIVCEEADCKIQKEPAEDQGNPACWNGPICWVWGAGSRYSALIWDDPVALFTALLFLSTTMLWVSTYQLWRGSEKTAERQLRAYVDLKAATLKPYMAGEIPEAKIKFINTGQTPAKNVTVDLNINVFNNPPDESLLKFKPLQSASRGTIRRDGVIYLPPLKMEDALTEEAFQRIASNEARIFVWGIVGYDDIFGRSQFTTIRLMNSEKAHLTRDQSMAICENGNDSS